MDKSPLSLKEWHFVLKKKLRKILPIKILNLYFSSYPFLGSLIYNNPSQKIKLIGITGTDGKSSTVIFVAKILQQAGYKVGFFSSVAYGDGEKENTNTFKMTMPGRFFLQSFIKKLVNNRCDFGVIEVTSEGVKQRRNLFIDFDVALITNLKPEHIESHGNFEKYKLAKSEIFKNLSKSFNKDIPKSIVVNGDDKEAKTFLQFDANQKIDFGVGGNLGVRGEIISSDLFESIFRVYVGEQSAQIKMQSGGPFTMENALAAIAVAQALKIDLKTCAKALESIKNPPGRFEIVSKDPIVIVDYAHTIAAVEKVLSFVRKNWQGRIIHVFGAAGGGRDKWKRPDLARLSEKYTDFSILTEENSFDEPIENILEDISVGFQDNNRIAIIPNRKDAVTKAIEMTLDFKNTLLLLTAKGSETVIAGPFGRKTPYNEKETVLCLLNK